MRPSAQLTIFLMGIALVQLINCQTVSDPYVSTTGSTCDLPPSLITIVNSSTTYALPSQPIVSVTWDGLYLRFEVTVDFVQDHASYFLDFIESSNTENAFYTFCSNRAYDDTSDFYKLWTSPPDYLNATYNNYGTWPTTHYWSRDAVGCNRIRYQAPIQLSNMCKDENGGRVWSTSVVNDKIVFEGTLYIKLNRANNINENTRVDNLASWKQPFRLELSNIAASVSGMTIEGPANVTGESIPRVDPRKVGISETGQLVISITTELKESSSSSGGTNVLAGNPLALASPVALAMNGTDKNDGIACVSPCIQNWMWVSTDIHADYSGLYKFQFSIVSATSKRFVVGSSFSVSFQIQLKPTGTVFLNGSSVPSSLVVFKDYFGQGETNNFKANARVYATQQLHIFSITVNLILRNVWFCYNATWNPMAGQMGCLSVDSNKRVQLVSNGTFMNITGYDTYSAQFGNNKVGFSFKAKPLSPNKENYLLQIESTIQSLNKRSFTESNRQEAVIFDVEGAPPQVTFEEEVQSSASLLVLSNFVLGFFVALIL